MLLILSEAKDHQTWWGRLHDDVYDPSLLMNKTLGIGKGGGQPPDIPELVILSVSEGSRRLGTTARQAKAYAA